MIQLSRPQRYGLSILTGVLLGFAFPYTGSLFFLSFLAWVPLLFLEDYLFKKRYRTSKFFWHAYLSFFFYNLIATWWVVYASLGGAIMAVFANALVMTLPVFFFHTTKKYVGKKEGYLSLPIYWIGMEYLHFHWDLSWPWLDLGNVFSRVPELVQWYSYTGVLGGTFWVLVVNLIAFRIVQNVYLMKESWKIQTPIFYALAFVLIVPIGISLYQYTSFEEVRTKEVSGTVIQPNMDPYSEKFTRPLNAQLSDILQLASKSPKADLILAPETALAYEFYEEDFGAYDFGRRLRDTVQSWKNEWLIGASTRRAFEVKNSSASRKFVDGPGYYESYNTSLFLNQKSDPRFVHKSKLVLGVEKIPFVGYLPFLEDLAIDLDGASGTLGIEKEPQVLQTKDGLIAPVVCYESVYGEFIASQVNKGAEMICVITNDGWWQDTPGYRQHWSFSRLRAIENRKYVARSANTGWSGFIDARGKDIARSDWWEPTAINQKVPYLKGQTFYAQHGDIFGRSFGFVTVLLLLFTQVKRFKAKFSIGAPKEKKVI
ncbi:MAG: apolipoprotein N-acyltransferase [Crocinitomicaceae bacterium]|jgi:apolipoprotein N-acyltransferase|nr:apolipoprotein N-acyltransferase [Crocinitomicaceae bacterium]